MDFENQIPDFFEWIGFALKNMLLAILMLAFVGWMFGFLVAAIRRGPVEGFYAVWRTIFSGVGDLVQTSFRRTFAMVLLALQEAIRRKVLVAFAVFVVII